MRAEGFRGSEVYLLHEITTRLDRIARVRFLAPAGITYPEFLVLMAARELPAPTQEQVSSFVDMSKSLVSQRVSALIRKGLLGQEGDPEDRRVAKLALTAAGKKEIAGIYGAMVSSSDAIFSGMGDSRHGFRGALVRLAEGLAREEERDHAHPAGARSAGPGRSWSSRERRSRRAPSPRPAIPRRTDVGV